MQKPDGLDSRSVDCGNDRIQYLSAERPKKFPAGLLIPTDRQIKAFDLTVYGHCVRFQFQNTSSHTPTCWQI